MKLEIGKCYVTRGGQVTGPLEDACGWCHPDFTFRDPISGLTWREDGSYLPSGEEDDDDIVAELSVHISPTRPSVKDLFGMLDNFPYSDDPMEAQIERLEIEREILRRARNLMGKAA